MQRVLPAHPVAILRPEAHLLLSGNSCRTVVERLRCLPSFPHAGGDNQSGTANKDVSSGYRYLCQWDQRFHHFMSLGVNECEQVVHVYATVAPALANDMQRLQVRSRRFSASAYEGFSPIRKGHMVLIRPRLVITVAILTAR